MQNLALLLALSGALLGARTGRAQGVGIGTTAPDAAAVLDLSSTTKGLLLPRLSARQRAGIPNPVAGLTVFQTNGTMGIYYFNGFDWVNQTDGIVPDANGSTGSTRFVSTLAGQPGVAGSVDGTGAAAQFYHPQDVAVDASTNTLYVTDSYNNLIRKIDITTHAVTTLAGDPSGAGYANGTGAAARFNRPGGIVVDGSGTLYVADALNCVIRRVTAAGVVTTVAGTPGTPGFTDGPAATARFNAPYYLALNAAGTELYVSDDSGHNIRKIVLGTGIVSTLAGPSSSGNVGYANGTGSAARFSNPEGLAVDAAGTIYVCDFSNQCIRKISITGVVSTLAGLAGNAGSADGLGSAARFMAPNDLAVSASGTLYVVDGATVRSISPAGLVTTLYGRGGETGSRDGVPAVALFTSLRGIGLGPGGVLYVADSDNNTIRAIR